MQIWVPFINVMTGGRDHRLSRKSIPNKINFFKKLIITERLCISILLKIVINSNYTTLIYIFSLYEELVTLSFYCVDILY